MKALDFVRTAHAGIKFDICFNEEWSDELFKDEALKFIEQANEADGFDHCITYWSISRDHSNGDRVYFCI